MQLKASSDASRSVQSLAEVNQSSVSAHTKGALDLAFRPTRVSRPSLTKLSVLGRQRQRGHDRKIMVSMATRGTGESSKREATKDQLMHRWIKEEDPTFEKYAFLPGIGYVCQTPEKFAGQRTAGAYPGSVRVQFTLPGKEDEPVTIELLRSRGYDNPSFGAVKAGLPFGAAVYVKNSRVVVGGITEGSNAQKAGIREDDIIRGVSFPQSNESGRFSFLKASAGQAAEEGMLILDGKSASDYNEALQQHYRANDKDVPVVLLIERPITSVAKDLDEEYVLRASDSFADDLSELERETEVGTSTVYIAKLPTNPALDSLDENLQDAGIGFMYPRFLEHSLVLVQHGGQTGCTAYDFVAEHTFFSSPENLADAISGKGWRGRLRKMPMRRIPRRFGTERVGVVRADLGSPEEVDKAIAEFSSHWDTKVVLLQNDCRHYAGALLRLLVEGREPGPWWSQFP